VTTDALITRWREQAVALRRYAAAGQAEALEQCAAELEAALDQLDGELITLATAATECGYSADHLGRLIRSGRLTNHGRDHAPRVRRGELPRKAHRRQTTPLRTTEPSPDMEALTRDIIVSKQPRRAL
jgi:hypothetical protein